MGIWEFTNTSKDRKLITNKWVFMQKYNEDGELLKYKAQLVARGFIQISSMDYNEIFTDLHENISSMDYGDVITSPMLTTTTINNMCSLKTTNSA